LGAEGALTIASFFVGGAAGARKGTAALRFSQTTASSSFSAEGSFAGRTIGQVANGLRNGQISSNQVPVGFVSRDGIMLIENTRSSLALRRANIPASEWSFINKTGNPLVEGNITNRLFRNNLTNQGTETLRITGAGKGVSSLQ
jgi:hypothetical protein